MPRQCTICMHEDRTEMDGALLTPEPLRGIARRFAVSEDALFRHKRDHISTVLVKAHEAGEIAQADSLLEQVKTIQARTLSILDRADDAGDLRTALSAIRETRANLELLAKLLGELDERPVVNIVTSPQWIQLRSVVVGALEAHPSARMAVLRALEGVEDA